MLKVAVVFVFCFCLISSENLTPDDEDFSTGGVLDYILTQLESISGLSNLEPNSTVSGINCPGIADCIINPNGTVLWNVRSDMYRTHLMQNYDDETSRMTTIDGCLKYNPTDVTSYRSCMSTVRREMGIYLIIEFISMFRSLIEEDCSLVNENCVGSTS